ncbi:PadR family transcriptional regulator [Trinickia dabaoshanensis]|uniref:PadR family transcriptional regulator n=1 Tax=Trinickia dabaoshanensis TaxID=564714 RepID=A0A2N7VPV9_9BURK|nr:PadR family transcriptional regulator [Trinickia dabaoshanensis]PMS19135.1 PadR family transcriptional regulator [Trinickia dabaoshanensis]
MRHRFHDFQRHLGLIEQHHAHARGHGHRGQHDDRRFLHDIWHAVGRHRHGHGGGASFWGGRGERGFGDDDSFTRGRKFSGEDLQLMLLVLIAETPRHGYELIKALETRSNGFYAPSPGMVYPALTYLEELGFVTVQQEGNRKRYEIADAGRAHLAANKDQVDMILAKLSFVAHKMETMRRAYAAEDDDDGGRDAGWHPKLRQAKYALKLALLRRLDADASEQQRVADILLRAAAEIEGKPAAGPAPEGANL